MANGIARVGSVTFETLGVAVRRATLSVPEAAFIVPKNDAFRSVVTRDVVADPSWRGFAFHFKEPCSRDAKRSSAARRPCSASERRPWKG